MPWRRWTAAAALLLAEYLFVTIYWDVGQLRPTYRLIGSTGALAPVVFLSLTALVVLWRRPGEVTIRALAEAAMPGSPRWGFLVGHLLCAALFFPLSHRVLGRTLPPPDQAPGLVAAWGVAALLLAASAAAWAFPARALRPLAKISGRPALAALLVGLAAWGAGLAAFGLWPLLARVTLTLTSAAMRPIWGARLFVDPSQQLLGLGEFVAHIGEPCSGAEGMGLMAVLGTAYLIKFRQTLAMPRALVLVPLAMGLSFLANIVRLMLLIWVGDAVSPDMAVQGFHSKAGWVLTCAIAIGVLAWVRTSRWLARAPAAHAHAHDHAPSDNPTALHLSAVLVGSALALLTGLFSTGFDRLFWLRILGMAVALWFTRSAFAGIGGRPRVAVVPVAVGVVVFLGWLLVARRAEPDVVAAVTQGLAEMGPIERASWLLTRVLGAVVIIPLAEELAFRGFLLRRFVRDDFWEVTLAAAAHRPLAVLLSSVIFGLLHGAFIAGTLAGLAYALVLRWRGRLGDAVVAHTVTNALLVVYTLVTGDWSFMA